MKEEVKLQFQSNRLQKHGLNFKKKRETQCGCGSTLAIFNNCVTCLKKVKFEYNLSWMVPGLKCGSKAKIQELANKDIKDLVENKKLRLVLDLDETLIHAKKITEEESDSEEEETLDEMSDDFWSFPSSKEEDIIGKHHSQQSDKNLISGLVGAPLLEHSIVRVGHHQYKVWIRPYLIQFLETIERHFDIYIYTHATRDYANTILEALDIKRYIKRICARDPKEKRKRKKLSKMLCQPNLSLIVDDKRRVWSKEDHANVVRVAPFTGKPQERHDQVLETLTSILLNAHSAYYMVMKQQKKPEQQQEINFSVNHQMTSTTSLPTSLASTLTDIRSILSGC
mmetsp:Transcript_783/g.1216  ORF Transcript_783/g.1216 Transcript_783/m.1216 type:complete len:339 (-) Transcript_783:44-1060(-)